MSLFHQFVAELCGFYIKIYPPCTAIHFVKWYVIWIDQRRLHRCQFAWYIVSRHACMHHDIDIFICSANLNVFFQFWFPIPMVEQPFVNLFTLIANACKLPHSWSYSGTEDNSPAFTCMPCHTYTQSKRPLHKNHIVNKYNCLQWWQMQKISTLLR